MYLKNLFINSPPYFYSSAIKTLKLKNFNLYISLKSVFIDNESLEKLFTKEQMFDIIKLKSLILKRSRLLKKTYYRKPTTSNSFLIPKEIFALGLKAEEIALYSYLLFCENWKTHTCYPSYKNIGRAVNMTTNTVRKYVSSLEEKNLIETEETTITRQNGKKYNGNLKYTILPIEDAMRSYQEKILQEMEVKNKIKECKEHVG